MKKTYKFFAGARKRAGGYYVPCVTRSEVRGGVYYTAESTKFCLQNEQLRYKTYQAAYRVAVRQRKVLESEITKN